MARSDRINQWSESRSSAIPTKRRHYFEIPAFTSSVPDATVPVMGAQFNYTATEHFTIKTLATKPDGVNFIPCIRYRVGDTVYRYKLWDVANELLFYPLYTGEVILKNFVIEIYNVAGQPSPLSATAIRYEVSITELTNDPTNFSVVEDCIGASVADIISYKWSDNFQSGDSLGVGRGYSRDNPTYGTFAEYLTGIQLQSNIGFLGWLAGTYQAVYCKGAVQDADIASPNWFAQVAIDLPYTKVLFLAESGPQGFGSVYDVAAPPLADWQDIGTTPQTSQAAVENLYRYQTATFQVLNDNDAIRIKCFNQFPITTRVDGTPLPAFIIEPAWLWPVDQTDIAWLTN